MKRVTSNYKTAITKPKQIDANLIIDGENVDIDQINGISKNFNTQLFKTVMQSLVLDTNNLIELNKQIIPQFGLYVNDSFEYISLGNFKVISSSKNEDTISFETKAYDKILDSMIDFDLDVAYPISVRDYWIAIFNRLNWDTSGIPPTFINSTKMIYRDLHSGINYTFRDVLDELCTISCAFLIDKNGIPSITYPNMTSSVIDEEYMNDKNVKIGEKIFFNSLVFSRAENSDNIYRKDDESINTNGLHEFCIPDNQLLSTNDRDEYIDEMWEYLKTFEYYSFDIDTKGVTFLEPIDCFSLKIGGNLYPTILLNDELQICNGVFETMYNEKPKETITEYKYADRTDKKINQTYLIVDKQNQKIESVVSQTNENSNKIVEVTHNINNIQNLFQITGGNNLIKNSVGLFKDENWIKSENGIFEFGEDSNLIGKTTSRAKISVSNGRLTTSSTNIVDLTLNEQKTLNFKAKQDENTTTTIILYGLDENNPLYSKTFIEAFDWQEIFTPDENQFFIDSPNLTLAIESTSAYDGKFYISDLMLNNGDKTEWQLSRGEVSSTTIKMSQDGITVYMNTKNIATLLNADGLQIRKLNGSLIGDIVTEFNSDGIFTKNIEHTGQYVQKNYVRDVTMYNGFETYFDYIRG